MLSEKYSADNVFYSDVMPRWIEDTHSFWYVRKTPEGRQIAHETMVREVIDALIVIGGDGSLTGARLLAEEFDTSVSTLLGETMHEESLNEGSLKNISEKLEVINLQFAKKSERKIKTIRYSLILVCVFIAVVFIALVTMNSEYLTWNFNDPELAIVGTLLHGFEFLFVRLAPFAFIGSIIGIIFTYKKR